MKNWVLLAGICLAASSFAVPTRLSPWAEPHGAFFALSVPDAEASAAWYQKHLGFQVISKGEAPNKIARGILLQGNGSLLEIVQPSKAKPLKTFCPTQRVRRRPMASSRSGFAFVISTPHTRQ